MIVVSGKVSDSKWGNLTQGQKSSFTNLFYQTAKGKFGEAAVTQDACDARAEAYFFEQKKKYRTGISAQGELLSAAALRQVMTQRKKESNGRKKNRPLAATAAVNEDTAAGAAEAVTAAPAAAAAAAAGVSDSEGSVDFQDQTLE